MAETNSSHYQQKLLEVSYGYDRSRHVKVPAYKNVNILSLASPPLSLNTQPIISHTDDVPAHQAFKCQADASTSSSTPSRLSKYQPGIADKQMAGLTSQGFQSSQCQTMEACDSL